MNGALPAPPVLVGPTGVIGEPVADGFDPAPEPEGPEPEEPVPIGYGAPVAVANPVEPAAPEELTDVVLVHEQTVS